MTYIGQKQVDCVMIEVSLSASQTVSSGDIILWDTIRASGSHGVSVNSSTGVISLDTSKHYHIRCSVDVERSSYNDMRFAFIDSTATEITAVDGGYDANFFEDVKKTFTMVAVYQSQSPLASVRLKAVTVPASSTVLTSMSMFILEVTP